MGEHRRRRVHGRDGDARRRAARTSSCTCGRRRTSCCPGSGCARSCASTPTTSRVPILMKKEQWDATAKEQVVTDEDEQINQASALWARAKSEITEEQYHEFYKHVAHDFEPPLAYVHAKRRGPPGVHAAVLHPAAGAVRSLGPRAPARHQALRPPRVHHGRCRAADAAVPAIRARRDRLERPAAERVARNPAAVARRASHPHGVGQARARAARGPRRRTRPTSSRRSGRSSAACSRRASSRTPPTASGSRSCCASRRRTRETDEQTVSLADYVGRMKEGQDGDLLHHRRRLRRGAKQPAPRDLPQARRRSAADARPHRRMGRVDRSPSSRASRCSRSPRAAST